ncbi:MAG: LamG-like jellyroll fold domain-containing protein, partial [Thermoguttaceae bacterium]
MKSASVRTPTCLALLLLMAAPHHGPAEPPRLYVPFDGSLEGAVSSGAFWPQVSAEIPEFRAGVRGRSAAIDGDCRFPTAGVFDIREGTVAFWIRPDWPGGDPAGRSLFCLYGSPQLKEPWLRNRWSLTAGAGQLRYWICGAEPGQTVSLSTPIHDWQPAEWHHLAITWANINSGRSDARVALYVDGKLAESREGLRLDVGPIGEVLDIGRDSDASADYATADYDEFYLYAQ